MTNHISWLKSKNVDIKNHKYVWDAVISTMNSSDDSHYWESSGIKEIKKLDKIRNEDFTTSFPHLADMLDVKK